MRRSITLCALLLAAACGGSGRLGDLRIGKGPALNYAQAQSLEEGMEAKSVLNAFGTPLHVLERGGKVRGLTYWCEDAAGKVRELRMVFGEDERLAEWALGEPPAK